MFSNYFCALDIGSSKIAAALALVRRGHIQEIFLESLPAKGIKKGVIVDSIDLLDSLEKVLKNLRSKSGINVKSVYANFSGENVIAKYSHAIIPLAERGNKLISVADINRVNHQARILGSSLDEEIIHAVPVNYTLDAKNTVSNPLGLYSHSLEADLYLVCARVSYLQSLNRVINQAACEIKDVFFSGISTARVVFNQEMHRGVNILCDIGNDTTEILLYKDGILRDMQILYIGGNDLSQALQDNLKIPLGLAEEIKIAHASIAELSKADPEKEVLIKKSSGYKPIKEKQILQILNDKSVDICQKIKQALDKNVPYHNEINNFIVVGRNVLMDGFLEMLEKSLDIAVKLGRPVDPRISNVLNKSQDATGYKYLNYLSALGIICQALYEYHPRHQHLPANTKNILFKTIHKVKEVYQEYF